MDGIAQPRGKREHVLPRRYHEETSNPNPTSSAKAPAKASASSNADHDADTYARAISGSQHVGDKERDRPRRNPAPTERGGLDAEARAAARQQHEDKVRGKKRKAVAEERGNALQPGPLPPASKRSKGKQVVVNLLSTCNHPICFRECDHILFSDRRLEDLIHEEDRIEWMHQALEARDGEDYRKLRLPFDDLQEIWDDVSDAAATKGTNNNHSGIKVDEKSHLMQQNQAPTTVQRAKKKAAPKRQPPTLAKLSGTDHTTIGLDNANLYPEHPRASNGKPTPIEGSPLMTNDEVREFRARYSHLGPEDFKQLMSTRTTPRHHPFPPSSRPAGPGLLFDAHVAPNNSAAPGANSGPVGKPAVRPNPTATSNSVRNPTRAQPNQDITRRVPHKNAQERHGQPDLRGSLPTPHHSRQPPPKRAETRQVVADDDADGDDAADVEAVLADPSQPARRETKKALAQLWRFGDASPFA